MEEIKNNKYSYSELGMYLIHMEASRTHRRLVFKRPELLEVRSRLAAKYPLLPYDVIPTMEMRNMPVEMLDFLRQFPYQTTAIKVEWFYGGIYHYDVNQEYKSRFTLGRKGDRQVYSKTCDTIGFNNVSMAFKMWMESVDRPGVIIKYEDVGLRVDLNIVVHQCVRMLSKVLDCEHVITLTVVQ